MRFFREISLIRMHEDLFLHNVKSLIPLNHFHITVYLLSGLCVYNVFILCARARVCVCARTSCFQQNTMANVSCHILILTNYANLGLIQLFSIIKAVSFKLQQSSILRGKINLSF